NRVTTGSQQCTRRHRQEQGSAAKRRSGEPSWGRGDPMTRKDNRAERRAGSASEQLIAVIGEKHYRADWTNNRHRARRLLSEFIGTFGLLFVLSAGAGAITSGAGAPVNRVALVALLSATSALWLVAAIYALGDVSAHFNPAMTFAFALRGD